jgi:hypothetical protein
MNAAEQLSPDAQNRLDRLVRATQPEMIRPSGAARLGAGHPKRLYRRLRAAWWATHELLSDFSFEKTFAPNDVIAAVSNHERAQSLLAQARRLPRTHLGAKARAQAQDNADVALEVVALLANEANRAPALNGR